jgi:hypothetical protein
MGADSRLQPAAPDRRLNSDGRFKTTKKIIVRANPAESSGECARYRGSSHQEKIKWHGTGFGYFTLIEIWKLRSVISGLSGFVCFTAHEYNYPWAVQ